MRNHLIAGVLVMLGAGCLPVSANASSLVFTYTGIVNDSFGIADLFGGDPLTGSFVIDTAALDSAPGDLTMGIFQLPVQTVSFAAGTYLFTGNAGAFSFTTTRDNYLCGGAGPPCDTYEVSLLDFESFPGFGIGLFFAGNDTTANSSDAILSGPIDFSKFTGHFNFYRLDNSELIDGTITSLTVQPVPEPATLLLFGAGLAAAAMRRSRRQL